MKDKINYRQWQCKVIGVREGWEKVSSLFDDYSPLLDAGEIVSARAVQAEALGLLRMVARAYGMGCAGSCDGRWDWLRKDLTAETGVTTDMVSHALFRLHQDGCRGALAAWMKVNDALETLEQDNATKAGAQLVIEEVDY